MVLAITMFAAVHAYAVGEATGNIRGTVENTDGSGYVVTATNAGTGAVRDVAVAADGGYRFSQMSIGTYELTVEKDGILLARDTVSVTLSANTVANFPLTDHSRLDEITVTASSIVGDTYSTDSGLVMVLDDIKAMPVTRDITGISMLAPGTVLGDSKFSLNGGIGNASFGGSSIAENSCYINGLEVTNTRQGIGCGAVPFEMYEQFQVKTGGYSAQYGRTTGGVLNAVTKSGSNEWEFFLELATEPESMYEEGQISLGGGALGGGVGGPGTGRMFRDTRDDSHSLTEFIASASGPIIEDHLFIYAIVNPRDEEHNFSWQTGAREQYSRDDEYRRMTSDGSDNLFWGAKIDWDITDDHRLSYFQYSNRNDSLDVHFARDPNTDEISDTPSGEFLRQRGGEAFSASYVGHITDSLTISAMYGVIETEYTSDPDDTTSCPTVADNRSPAPANPITGCGPGGAFGANFDENTQTRLDIEWSIGDHLVRAGLDKQDRQSTRISQPIGGHSYTYSTLGPLATIQGNSGPIYTNNTGVDQEYAFDRIFTGGGGFSSDLEAFYIEDEWAITDDIVVYLGARKDRLENVGTTGVTFAKFDQEWAPRLGFSWDPTGSGNNKIYSTWGRYYLPVPNNTNFRVASGVDDSTVYYDYTGVDGVTGAPTGLTPISGDLAGSTVTNSVGGVPSVPVFQAAEADPFFKEEFIIGYERTLSDEWIGSVRFINREVGATLDDFCGPITDWCILLNPGSGGTWARDTDFDGVPDGPPTFYDAATIKLPEGKNEYNSLQFQFDHANENVNYSFVYVWSQSIGNFEGAVKSDIVQVDAGITQDFDFPALMDRADGYLPNDRRHAFKFYGTYYISDNWSAGWNASLFSGRPLNNFGSGYPDNAADVFGSYGDTYYIFTNNCNNPGGIAPCTATNAQEDKIYTPTQRGDGGRTSWTANLDASVAYQFQVSNVAMTANLYVFNLLNIQEATSVNEHVEARRSEGNPNEWYGAAYNWQTPRHVRLSLSARF